MALETYTFQDPFVLATLTLSASPRAGHEPTEYEVVVTSALDRRRVTLRCVCDASYDGFWDGHDSYLELLRDVWVRSGCAV